MKSIKPIISEKTMRLARSGQYTFLVDRAVSKLAIAQDLARIYGVPIVASRVATKPAKIKQTGGRQGRRPAKRKLIVTLKPGHTLPGWENNQSGPTDQKPAGQPQSAR